MRKAIYSPEYQHVKELFIKLRETAGLTQRELAERLDREYSMIGRIETGQRRVDIVEFYWICEKIGVDARVAYRQLIDRIEASAEPGKKAADPPHVYRIHRKKN